jgi:hypothetical protein
MTDRRRFTPIFGAIVLILAGCGGGTGASPTAAPAGGVATSGPTQATTADAPAATTEPAGGGGSTADVCGLVTPEELAGVFKVPSVTTSVLAGPPATCTATAADGTTLAAWVLSHLQAGSIEASVYGAMMSDPSAIQVSGIGDKAAHVENTGFLVLKGDSFLSIGSMAGAGDLSDEERRKLAEQLGAIAAGRM